MGRHTIGAQLNIQSTMYKNDTYNKIMWLVSIFAVFFTNVEGSTTHPSATLNAVSMVVLINMHEPPTGTH